MVALSTLIAMIVNAQPVDQGTSNKLRLVANDMVLTIESQWPLRPEDVKQLPQQFEARGLIGTIVLLTGEVIYSNNPAHKIGQSVDLKEILFLDNSYIKLNKHWEKLGFPLIVQGRIQGFIIVEQPQSIQNTPPIKLVLASYVMGSIVSGLILLLGIVLFRKQKNPLSQLSKSLNDISKGILQPLEMSTDPNLKEVYIHYNVLVEELSYLLIQQQKNEEQKKLFLNTISHELKTPISTINAYIEGLMYGVAKDEATKVKYIQIIHEKMQKLMTQIDDLFMYTQEQSSQFKYNFKEMYADDLFEPIFRGLEQTGKNAVLIDNKLPKCLIKADAVRLEQVIMNLYNNAKKHSEPSKPMQIRAYRQENEIWIEVEDHGNGIHHEDLPYIFDYYFQGTHSQKTDYEGIGMGLAICKEIIEKHQGRMIVKSKMNLGTTMIVVLPL